MPFDIEEVVHLRKETDRVRVLCVKEVHYVSLFLIRLMSIKVPRYHYSALTLFIISNHLRGCTKELVKKNGQVLNILK